MDLHELHRLFAYAWAALFVVLMVAAVFISIGTTLLRARAARNWPKARGTIIRSELVPETNFDDPDAPQILTYPVVEYAYEVDGRKYQSRQLSIVVGATPGPAPADLIALYPSGATVPVSYNPANHADGALDCRVPAKVARFMVKTVVVILAVGLAGIFIFTPAGSMLREAMSQLWRH